MTEDRNRMLIDILVGTVLYLSSCGCFVGVITLLETLGKKEYGILIFCIMCSLIFLKFIAGGFALSRVFTPDVEKKSLIDYLSLILFIFVVWLTVYIEYKFFSIDDRIHDMELSILTPILYLEFIFASVLSGVCVFFTVRYLIIKTYKWIVG